MTTPVIPSTGSPVVVRPYWDSAAIWQYGTIPPSGFLPTQVSALSLWLDASQIAGVSSGASLATWTDMSGANNNATNSLVTQQPKFIANRSPTGLPAVNFVATTFLDTSTGTQAQPFTVFSVYSLPASAANAIIISSRNGNQASFFKTNTNGIQIFCGAGLSTSTSAVSIWQWALGIANGSNSSIRADSDTYRTGNAGATSAGSGWRVGALFDNSLPIAGDIGEIIVYNKILTVTELSQVTTYLIAKWGAQ